MKKRVISLIVCITLILSVVLNNYSYVNAVSLNLTNQSMTIEAGKSFKIKLNGLNPSKVKWSSSKKTIASVSKKGVVTGVSKGKAVITGKYKGLKFKINVTVNSKVVRDLVIETDNLALYYVGCEMCYGYMEVKFKCKNKTGKKVACVCS